MHEKLMDIQNSFWKEYKCFGQTKDMRQYNKDMGEIISRYKGDVAMSEFIKRLGFAWIPIINGMMEGGW